MTEYLAHVSEDKSRFHLLEDHLTGVADWASVMAAEFGASEWAYLAGLWHDLGKYSHEFQSMILFFHRVGCKYRNEVKPRGPLDGGRHSRG